MTTLYKAGVAAAACLGMQVPYAVNGDSDDAGSVGKILCTLVPVDGAGDFDGYDDHWWWDNLAHLLAGYAVGTALGQKIESRRGVLLAFLAVTTKWEIFEYVSNERPWHTNEYGEMEWSMDHAMEDTVLDTIMGLAGAWLSTR